MLSLLLLTIGSTDAYDPSASLTSAPIKVTDYVVKDETRNREIPIRVYHADGGLIQPVILFSHGLGGTNKGSAFLGEHWAKRRMTAVFLQHPGSDDSVWRGAARAGRMEAMRNAANGKNLQLRVGDVDAVIKQLEKWHLEPGSPLHRTIDTGKIGMSGHSFGAVTTQAVSGQKYGNFSWLNPAIKAALPMSPSEARGFSSESAFGSVSIPWMLMTGTEDSSPIGNTTPESRLQVYPALPAGDKFQLVLFEAEHSAFTERGLPGEGHKRNPNHHKAIMALSTAFWEAYVCGRPEAKEWLKSNEVRKFLEPKDVWQTK